MSLKLFVTGTDTNVGKTYFATALLRKFTEQGFTTLGIKPVASGCQTVKGKLYSNDALALQKNSSIKLPYDQINPFAFQPAIAPHIAAAQEKINLNVAVLKNKCAYSLNYPADICIVEGVGGWLVPLNQQETMADFVISAKLNVILVVGIRLGCLNHALLTYRAIRQTHISILGWVANCVDPQTESQAENINALHHWLEVPCLGIVAHQKKPADKLIVDNLLKCSS
jgi:dethiobiotin synthetase